MKMMDATFGCTGEAGTKPGWTETKGELRQKNVVAEGHSENGELLVLHASIFTDALLCP